MPMDGRYYSGVEADISQLNSEACNLFDSDYEVQTMNVSCTNQLQARKSNTLRMVGQFRRKRPINFRKV
jgi:hypothetical protein